MSWGYGERGDMKPGVRKRHGFPLVCAVAARPGPRFGWPTGRIDATQAELVAYAPVFFGRFKVRVRYDEIAEAIVEHGVRRLVRRGGVVRLRMSGGRVRRVVIRTTDDGYERIVWILRHHGVPVRA